eukprot:Gb_20916 [translate_table: standard]
MGSAVECVSGLFGGSLRHKKWIDMETVEMKVRMDCGGCERKVRKAVSSMSGVESVDVNRKMQKVTVSGRVEPNKVLKKVKATGKHAEFWPYVPYNVVSHPYTSQSYDKKAPAGVI